MLQNDAARYPDTEWVFQYSREFSNTEWDYAVEVCDAVTAVAADAGRRASSTCRPPSRAAHRTCSPTRSSISAATSRAATR